MVVVLGYFLGFSLLLGLYNVVPLGGRVLWFGVAAGYLCFLMLADGGRFLDACVSWI